jgi:hypothetical protein
MTAPSALSEALGFTVACAFLAAIGLIIWASKRWAAKRNATTDTRPASCPSTGAGRGHNQPACHSTGPRGGHYYRADGDWWVCASCGDRAPRRHVEVFDQEATA